MNRLRFIRRVNVKYLIVPLIGLSFIVTVSFMNGIERLPCWKMCPLPPNATFRLQQPHPFNWSQSYSQAWARALNESTVKLPADQCFALSAPTQPSIETWRIFPQLNFQPDYIRRRDYWDNQLEQRYLEQKLHKKFPLKVVVLPHSHNDPGWLRTFDDYFTQKTQFILDNMVSKMLQYKNMTFIWTEISFFSKWWDSATPEKRRGVKQLVDEGRLEFTSGTWVMVDEATSHLYSMLDQMIEGHQWLKSRLGITPKSVWSIDPFGHGPVAPYLLHLSGLNNTVMQRTHYAWKRWFADHQTGDFLWKLPWDTPSSILCHNFPFDIYSTKHSCGPNPQTCMGYDFRNIRGEYNELNIKTMPIGRNVKSKADVLVEQYSKSASLFPHNVHLALVGDDFRYDKPEEWDQQYTNYQRLFDYIKNQFQDYQADIRFGTLSDYFDAVRQRMKEFPVIRGDFFPYADIFSEGRIAYWTGYYTTRPFMKMLAREVEAYLRGAEILYTISLNWARQNHWDIAKRIIDVKYNKLIEARRFLALFQHHDGITGTSKAAVMNDYGEKLFTALRNAIEISTQSASLMLSNSEETWRKFRLLPDSQRLNFQTLPQKVTLDPKKLGAETIILYNSDPHFRHEVVRYKVTTPYVRVVDATGKRVRHQINPVWTMLYSDSISPQHTLPTKKLEPVKDVFQLSFVASLPPLSLTAFRIESVEGNIGPESTVIYCSDCIKTESNTSSPFQFHPLQPGDIQIANTKMKLLFDGVTGFLKAITKTKSGKTTTCSMQFAAYQSALFHSGAYLFLPDPNIQEPFIDVLKDQKPKIYILTGSVMSEISVLYKEILHSTTIFHKTDSVLSDILSMETTLDMGLAPNYREHEFFIRFRTTIRNNYESRQDNVTGTEFYTDQNGFLMTRRLRLASLGVEGNYYPITSSAYIQDTKQRLNLLVTRAHGFTSPQQGWMEFMLDRRMVYDDGRGMGEGVTDNYRTVTPFVLILEDRTDDKEAISRPSLLAHYVSTNLLYPAISFIVDSEHQEKDIRHSLARSSVLFLNQPFLCNIHLINFRTLSIQGPYETELPSNSALLIIQNRGYDCSMQTTIPHCATRADVEYPFYQGTSWIGLNVSEIHQTSLTGLAQEQYVEFDSIRVPLMEVRSFNFTFL